jgi:hypothetical protein
MTVPPPGQAATLAWTYASLSLVQSGWPGRGRAPWVASVAGGEVFRTPDLLSAMDRLGAQGWELVTFAPAWDDRSAAFYFKAPATGEP